MDWQAGRSPTVSTASSQKTEPSGGIGSRNRGSLVTEVASPRKTESTGGRNVTGASISYNVNLYTG